MVLIESIKIDTLQHNNSSSISLFWMQLNMYAKNMFSDIHISAIFNNRFGTTV